MSLDGHCCQSFQINASSINNLLLFFFNSACPLQSPNKYSPRLCTPRLFNEGWTREGALGMLTWIKYERMHFLCALPGKAGPTSCLFARGIFTDANRHKCIWWKKRKFRSHEKFGSKELKDKKGGRGFLLFQRLSLRSLKQNKDVYKISISSIT